MADICDIARVQECIEAGAHEPVELPGGDDTAVDLDRYGVTFGIMMPCRRCGLMYWEPKPPPIMLEPVEEEKVTDDPEHERRAAAFWRWAEPSDGTEALQAFIAGCDYEAGVLEGLLEHMGMQTHGEFDLLRRVALMVQGWTGSAEDHAQAEAVFAKVTAYVKMRDQAEFLEKGPDADEG